LGDDLSALREGGTVQMTFASQFLVNWPKHLGGGNVYVDFEGSMVLTPLLSL
jgi:hypothetical protein